MAMYTAPLESGPALPPASSLTERSWLVWVEGGDPVGPVSADQIARGIRAGKVPPDARVQREGDVFWSDALDESDIIAALKSV
jgi:hypothetical protein